MRSKLQSLHRGRFICLEHVIDNFTASSQLANPQNFCSARVNLERLLLATAASVCLVESLLIASSATLKPLIKLAQRYAHGFSPRYLFRINQPSVFSS